MQTQQSLFSTVQLLIFSLKFFICSWSSTVRCHIHMQGDVAYDMYPILAVYRKIFNQLIHIFHWLVDSDLSWGILAKTAWFYCKWLQNDGALNFLHFFLGHPVHNYKRRKLVFVSFRHNVAVKCIVQWRLHRQDIKFSLYT